MLWGAAWGQDRASEPPFRAAALPGTHGHQPEGHRALTLPGRPSDRVRHHRLWDQVRTRDTAGAGCVLGPTAARPRSELQRASHEAGAALGRAEHRQQPRQGDPISDTRSPPLQPPSPRGPPKPVAFPHSFAAGDVVLILPQNAASHVQQFCQALGLDPDQCFTLQPREPGKLRDPRLLPLVPCPGVLWLLGPPTSPTPCRRVLPRAATPALLCAAPRVPVPGHRQRASTLLLRAPGLSVPSRAGAGQAAGAELRRGPGGAERVLQPAAQDCPGGAGAGGAAGGAGAARRGAEPRAAVLAAALLRLSRCRCCVTSRTRRQPSPQTTCWTSSPRSGPGPFPSPPPCW